VGLLVLQPHHPVLGLPQEGSTYYYNVSNRRTVQENLGEIHVSDHISNCKITIFQVILIGNRYHVRFSGYEAQNPYNYVVTNTSVSVSRTWVSFQLTTNDYDADNRSSSTRIDNFPEVNPIEDCKIFFVHPDWTAHTSSWNSSVEQIADHHCVNHALTLTYHSGRGEFQYSISVNIEGYAVISGDGFYANGTTTFRLYCAFDGDGVLLQYHVSESTHYFDDFNQVTYTTSLSVSRVTPGLLDITAHPFVIFQVILAVITLLVGIGVGFWIGQRQRRTRS
jgi:hypothetical protein